MSAPKEMFSNELSIVIVAKFEVREQPKLSLTVYEIEIGEDTVIIGFVFPSFQEIKL